MRSTIILLFLLCCIFNAKAQLFKNKTFLPDQIIPTAALSFTIDDSYRLYIRRICKPINAAGSPGVYANSLSAYECPSPGADDMLTEMRS